MFVGRTSEISNALKILKEGKRILHITGNSGVGKTTFAEELAKLYFDSYYHFYMDPEILQKTQKIASRRRKEININFFTEAYDLLRRINLLKRREVYDSIRDYILQTANNIIFDDAHTYNDFLSKIVTFIGLSTRTNIIIVTDKNKISSSPIAHTLKILREKGLMEDIELHPLEAKWVCVILKDELDCDMPEDIVEKFIQESGGDINFIKFLAAGYADGYTSIQDRFASLDPNSLEILGYICLAYMPLTLIDLMHLSGKSLDEIMRILEKLSSQFWISEIDGRFITSSKKMKSLVNEILEKDLLEKIHRKLAYMYDWENMHVAAAYHYEFFDKKMAAIHYRKEAQIASDIHAYSSAIKYLRKAWEITRSVEDLYSIAKIMLDVGDLRTMEEIAEEYRNDPRMACLLSIKNILEGNAIEAIKIATSSEKYLSGNMKIWVKIVQALALRHFGIYKASTDIAKEILKLSEEHNYIEGKAYSHFIIGTNIISEDVEKSIEHLERAFEYSRGTSLQYIVGIYYTHSLCLSGKIDEAENIIKIMKREVRGRYSFYERQIVKFCDTILCYYKKDWNGFLSLSHDLLRFFDESEIKIYKIDLLILLGDYYFNILGDYNSALQNYNQAFIAARNMVNPRLIKISYKKVKNLISQKSTLSS